jgi:signal transduction histidine kinase
MYFSIRNVLFGTLTVLFIASVYFVSGSDESLAILVILFLLGLVFYLVDDYLVIRPLKKLHKAFIDIGKGDLKVRLPAGLLREFGALFDSFNSMATALDETRTRDRALLRLKSDFVSTAAHQLRTPLSGIHWALSGLGDGDFGPLTPDQKKVIAEMQLKNTEVTDMVKILLDSLSVEQGTFGFEFEKANLEKIVDTSVADYAFGAKKSGVTLELKKEGTNFPPIIIDTTRIRWVINNLIENAIFYTPEGGKITVSLTYESNNTLHVSVSDTGIGIPKAEKMELFTKFFRGKNATKMRNGGNGLGLYIAKGIIERHKGKIWVDSEEGKGSTFYITLPVENGLTPGVATVSP